MEYLSKLMAREIEALRAQFCGEHSFVEPWLKSLSDTTATVQSILGTTIKETLSIGSEQSEIRRTQAQERNAIEELARRVRRLEENHGSGKNS